MTGDPSPAETRQVGSGRPRRGGLGVDEWVGNASLPLRKQGRMAMSVCAAFSDFECANDEGCIENENGQKE